MNDDNISTIAISDLTDEIQDDSADVMVKDESMAESESSDAAEVKEEPGTEGRLSESPVTRENPADMVWQTRTFLNASFTDVHRNSSRWNKSQYTTC